MESRHSHSDLVGLGARWARRQGFPVVTTEIRANGSREEPDVLAFRGKCSLLIEAKTSRADFFADFKKPERQSDAGSGLGVYRLYLCPAELLTIGDIPPKWGLLWARGRRIEAIKVPLGNTWPDHRTAQHYPNNWALYAHVPDQSAERAIMYSVARRRALTPTEQQYGAQLRQIRADRARLARRADALAEENRILRLAIATAGLPATERALPRRRSPPR